MSRDAGSPARRPHIGPGTHRGASWGSTHAQSISQSSSGFLQVKGGGKKASTGNNGKQVSPPALVPPEGSMILNEEDIFSLQLLFCMRGLLNESEQLR